MFYVPQMNGSEGKKIMRTSNQQPSKQAKLVDVCLFVCGRDAQGGEERRLRVKHEERKGETQSSLGNVIYEMKERMNE